MNSNQDETSEINLSKCQCLSALHECLYILRNITDDIDNSVNSPNGRMVEPAKRGLGE